MRRRRNSIIVCVLMMFGAIVFYSTNKKLSALKCVTDHQYQDVSADNVSEILKWAYQPKETWHKHFQKIFMENNLTFSSKVYPEVKCDSEFNQTLTESMEVVNSYSFSVPSEFLRELSLHPEGIDELSKPVTNPRKYPVIVTGASSNHFKESQGMIKTFHQLLTIHKDLKLIYYDLGLSEEEREELQKYCKCELRKYEQNKYPSQAADLQSYVWKPILIQTVLKEYDFVMWSDASVRFTGTSFDSLCKRARTAGLQTHRGGGAIMERTSKTTFDILKEKPCMYNTPEVEGSWSIISRNRFTLEYIIKPWVSCGLTENCMTYKNSKVDLPCRFGVKPPLHVCHRFDQSMLGILVNRLFHEQRSIVEDTGAQVYTLAQGVQSNYFAELRKQSQIT